MAVTIECSFDQFVETKHHSSTDTILGKSWIDLSKFPQRLSSLNVSLNAFQEFKYSTIYLQCKEKRLAYLNYCQRLPKSEMAN